MKIQDVVEMLAKMHKDGVLGDYAIGGAVGATFYLEPVATLDVDVFVAMQAPPGSLVISPKPLYDYLVEQGSSVEGEHVVIAGWPVQFLPPTGALVEEAVANAVEVDVEGVPARVLTAEYLAAICLHTGRAKDKARLLQFVESGALDARIFREIVMRHDMEWAWERFRSRFLEDDE